MPLFSDRPQGLTPLPPPVLSLEPQAVGGVFQDTDSATDFVDLGYVQGNLTVLVSVGDSAFVRFSQGKTETPGQFVDTNTGTGLLLDKFPVPHGVYVRVYGTTAPTNLLVSVTPYDPPTE